MLDRDGIRSLPAHKYNHAYIEKAALVNRENGAAFLGLLTPPRNAAFGHVDVRCDFGWERVFGL